MKERKNKIEKTKKEQDKNRKSDPLHFPQNGRLKELQCWRAEVEVPQVASNEVARAWDADGLHCLC